MAGAFKRFYKLPSKAVSAGGNVQIELLGLPLAARLARILLVIAGTGTAAASTQAVTPVNLASLIKSVDFDSDFFYVRATGRMLHALDLLMNGYAVASSAQSVTCDTNGVACKGVLNLPLADPRAISPNDTAVPVRLLREKTLNVNFADSLVIDLANDVTMSNTTLTAIAECVPEDGDIIPMKSRIYYEDWAQATANLTPYPFSHLGIYDETDLAVTLAQYSQISLGLDGSQVLDRVPTEALIAAFNQLVVRDAAQELTYQPTGNLTFIPLVAQPDKYKATQVLRCDGSARVDLEAGTSAATGGRFFYRQLVPVGEAEARNAAIRLGYDPDAATVQVKTASKGPLQGPPDRVARNAQLLPKRLAR